LSSGKVDDIQWRQGLVFIHNTIEIKGTREIIASHQKDLLMTHKDSRTILKVCMTPYEWERLIGSYSWPPEAFGLVLGVGWPREHVGNAFQTKRFQIQKVN
jgi:hypothetical protein